MEKIIEILDQYVDAKINLRIAEEASSRRTFARGQQLNEAKRKVSRLKLLLLACFEECLEASSGHPGGTPGP